MEKVPQKEKSRVVVAFVLIAVGIIWSLRELGIHYEIPLIPFDVFFGPLKAVLSRIIDLIFSWQFLLIFIGLLLTAGKRKTGIVLVIAGSVFLLPEILFSTSLSLAFLLPSLLIGAGVAMVVKYL